MIYLKILFFKIFLILIVDLEKTLCSNLTQSVQETKVPVSSLIGAFRPAEVLLSQNTNSRNSDCAQPFAKYIVSLRKSETDENFGYTHYCGGVIIQASVILTVAHCLVSNNQIIRPSSIRVVAKAPVRLEKTSATQIERVRKIVIHEEFSISGFGYDIAVLKLKKPLNLDSKCAAAVALPKQAVNNSSPCVVLGWGKLFLHGPLANEILQLNVTLHSRKFCELLMMDLGLYKICASDLSDYEKSPCAGDSGGPLICDGVLTGLVSYGYQCGYGIPTVYTDVYEYMNWIKKNSSNNLEFFSVNYLLFIFIVTLTTHFPY